MSPQIKVLQVVPTFYPATFFGGTIYCLFGLCNALSSLENIKLRVLTTDSSGLRWRDRMEIQSLPVQRPEGYEVYYSRKWWGKEFSGQLLSLLRPMLFWADVVHLTSAYSFSTIPTLLLCKLLHKPVVWSPHGALQRWQGSTKPILKSIWEIICNLLLNPSRCVLHVTSQEEAVESCTRITRARVELVANGANIPQMAPERSWMPKGRLRLLFIGRLDRKKGIENLLRALTMLEGDVFLNICGEGESGYLSSLKVKVQELGLDSKVHFLGHIDGEEKSRVFWNSDVTVVPSFTENFGMVVVESLSHGVPVIASRGTPWKRIVEYDCGLWVDNAPALLAKEITSIRNRDLNQMGLNGRKWMEEEFSWIKIAERMQSVYTQLADNTRHDCK